MPPPLALILCIGFTVFLLYLDYRQAPDVSPALWISTIWLVYVSSKSLAYWFGNPNSDYESGSPYDRSFQIVLLLISLWWLVRRGADWIGAMKRNSWLSALIVFMLVSSLWSPFPFVSFKRWASEILAVVLGLLISTEKDKRKAICSILRRTIYILIPFSWLLIKYFPQYGVEYNRWEGTMMWIGVATQKNGLGLLASLASFFLVWSLVKRRKHKERQVFRYQTLVDILILILSLSLLKGSGTYSATSIVMLAAGFLLYIGLMVQKKRLQTSSGKILTAIIVFIIIYGIAAPFVGKLPTGDLSSKLGRDSTLTGRSNIWKTLVPLAMAKPLLGYGFGGFWTTATRDRLVFFPAHNSYLETLLQLGFAGLILVSFFFISSSRKARNELDFDYDWGVLWICWLIMASLNNITESTLPSFANLLIAVPIWLAINFGDHRGIHES